MAKEASTVRQRQPSKAATGIPEQQAPLPDDVEIQKYQGLRPAVYYCWQYSGAVLALISLARIVTDTYEDDDPGVTKRLIANLLILLVALFAHESRPFKREFNIRWKSWDEVKQRGFDGSVAGLQKAEAEAAAASGTAAPAVSKKES